MKNMGTLFSLITIFLNGIYASLLAFAVVYGIALFYLVFRDKIVLRYVLHSFWCIISVVVVGVFFIGVIFFVITIGCFDLCETMDGYLNSLKEMKSLQLLDTYT